MMWFDDPVHIRPIMQTTLTELRRTPYTGIASGACQTPTWPSTPPHELQRAAIQQAYIQRGSMPWRARTFSRRCQPSESLFVRTDLMKTDLPATNHIRLVSHVAWMYRAPIGAHVRRRRLPAVLRTQHRCVRQEEMAMQAVSIHGGTARLTPIICSLEACRLKMYEEFNVTNLELQHAIYYESVSIKYQTHKIWQHRTMHIV